MKRKVRVQVPATSANLGPGFDILGIALRWFNEISFETDAVTTRSPASRELFIEAYGEGAAQLPKNESNLIVKAANRVFERAKRWPKNWRIKLSNEIPLSRGLGSSAAATLGGMVAANALIGRRLGDQEVLELAVQMEGHPDNVVPAFAGGLCVSGLINGKTWYYQLKAPTALRAVVCVPERPLPTAEARRVLPSTIPFNAAVFTSSRVAFLLGAFQQKKYEWLQFAMDDVLHQPPRTRLLPGLPESIQAAKKAGAYGAALSGAGSCVIAFVRPGLGKKVGPAMQSVFSSRGIGGRWVEVPFENRGVRVYA